MPKPLDHSARVLTDALLATKAQLSDREALITSPQGAGQEAYHTLRCARMRDEIADLELGLRLLMAADDFAQTNTMELTK